MIGVLQVSPTQPELRTRCFGISGHFDIDKILYTNIVWKKSSSFPFSFWAISYVWLSNRQGFISYCCKLMLFFFSIVPSWHHSSTCCLPRGAFQWYNNDCWCHVCLSRQKDYNLKIQYQYVYQIKLNPGATPALNTQVECCIYNRTKEKNTSERETYNFEETRNRNERLSPVWRERSFGKISKAARK